MITAAGMVEAGLGIGVIVSLQQIDTVAADQAIDGPVQGLGR